MSLHAFICKLTLPSKGKATFHLKPQHATCLIHTAPPMSKTPSLWADLVEYLCLHKTSYAVVLRQTTLDFCTGSTIHPYAC